MKKMFPGIRPYFWRYGVSIVTVAVALALKLLLQPLLEVESPFLIFFAAIIVSAWYGGRGSGFLATALASLLSDYFFLSPTYSFLNNSFGQNLRLALFALEGVSISLVAASLHSTKRRAKVNLLKLWVSEEQYRRIIDTAYEGILAIDAEGRTEYVNQRIVQMLGYSSEEMLGRPIYEFMDREARIEAEPRISQLQQGIKQQFDLHLRRKNGSALWAIVSINPILDEGNVSGAIAMLTDVTDRQQAESALRESEQRFRATFNSAAVGIAHVGINGQWLLVNQKLCDILGYTQEELLQQSFQDITHPDDLNTDLEYVRQILASEIQTYSMEKRYIRKNGSHVWTNLTVSLVRFPNPLDALQLGEPKYFISVIEDISERSLAEQALRESEKRFRRLVESNIFGVALGHFSGKITYANDYFLRMVGYERQELLAGKMRWDQMTPPEFLHLDVRGAAELKLNGVCTPFEKECLRQDGSRVPILIGAALVQEPDDRQEIITFCLDLSERKQTELALRERETRYRLVGRATNDAIWDWNLVTNEVEWNEGIQTLFGYWETDVGSDATWWHERIHPDDRQRVICGVRDVIDSGGQIWSDEYRFLLADKSYALVIDRGFVARDERGPVRMIGSIMDITQRQKAEKEREQLLAREQAARVEAEAANRLKDEFLATLSHELRTPLNAMMGWTQLLRTRKFDQATVDRALETIDRNTKSLAQLIEDVLDVSRIITGKLRLNIRPVELGSMISGAIETVHPAAEAKDIQIESRLDSSVGPVLGDENRLQQIVWNLLSNAVKFTPKQGHIQVCLYLEHSRVQISVSDTGQGISPDFLPYVFERFRQADSTTTRSYGGIGLGLAIVRHLVELHGGTVHAQSPGIGKGATFIVNLPLMAVARQVSLPKQIQPVKSEVLASNLPLVAGLRVLVVDDEADARELLVATLKQYGAEVTDVATVSEALEVLPRLKPDVLVSDIGMPGADGYALIRQVRALAIEQGGQTPAVALTAYARAEDRTQALLAGFQFHIPKPVNPAELAAVVANLAGRTENI